jgi:hypothetical protein
MGSPTPSRSATDTVEKRVAATRRLVSRSTLRASIGNRRLRAKRNKGIYSSGSKPQIRGQSTAARNDASSS